MSPVLFTRQQSVAEENRNDWWFSSTAIIVKWAIMAAVVLFFIWFVGGYFHAQRRIRRGLQPMKYHRFLVPQAQRLDVVREPQAQFSFYQVDQHDYHMNAIPPPVYDPSAPMPPTYRPHDGMSKVNPDQTHDVPPSSSPPGELPPRPEKKNTNWTSRILPSRHS